MQPKKEYCNYFAIMLFINIISVYLLRKLKLDIKEHEETLKITFYKLLSLQN